MNIVKMLDSIYENATVEKVTALLQTIPRHSSKFPGLTPLFCPLVVLNKNGVRCAISIQGSFTHYCQPKENFNCITDYEQVEIGLIGDKPPGFEGINWLSPSEFGFTYVKESNDDVHGFVPMKDLIFDLVNLFHNGCTVDMDNEKIRYWIEQQYELDKREKGRGEGYEY
jgi:hypothetical protein